MPSLTRPRVRKRSGRNFAAKRPKNNRMGDSIALQKRADELALRLSGDDRLLVFELCQELRHYEAKLTEIRHALA